MNDPLLFLGNHPPPAAYFNRKGYYSINCMVVVDNLKRIRHFTSRHCGSAHDSKIFGESHLRAKLERDFDPEKPRVLIGDEGYRCLKFLLTPIREDRITTESQRNYNKALSRVRITVEHSFGILKKRFPALLYQMRCRKISNAQAIIGKAKTSVRFIKSVTFHKVFVWGKSAKRAKNTWLKISCLKTCISGVLTPASGLHLELWLGPAEAGRCTMLGTLL